MKRIRGIRVKGTCWLSIVGGVLLVIFMTGCASEDTRTKLGTEWDITIDDVTGLELYSAKAGSISFDNCQQKKLERYGKEILELKLGRELEQQETQEGAPRFETTLYYQTPQGGETTLAINQYENYLTIQKNEETTRYFETNIDVQDTFSSMTQMIDATNQEELNSLKAAKPVIYLYPKEKMRIQVLLEHIRLTCTYPVYQKGWDVTAEPDGTIYTNQGATKTNKNAVSQKLESDTGQLAGNTDRTENREYYCLYYEGIAQMPTDFSTGFVIEKKDYRCFLEEKLAILGLNNREAQEFIIYWLPIMQQHEVLLIHFLETEELQKYVPLKVTPEPDSMIRVFMQFAPIEKGTKVTEQKLAKALRKGYSVIEWGGSDLARE